MNSLILFESRNMPFHTVLKPLVDGLGPSVRRYQWLLTDFEIGEDIPIFTGKDQLIISGEELLRVSEEFPRAQFIWGVFTALPLDLQIDLNDLEVYPVAESGNSFWQISPTFQHPQAIAEIVCWDSSMTILISKDVDMTAAFRGHFAEAESLVMHNKSFKNSSGIKE